MSTSFIYDPHFLDHETGTHPDPPSRLEAIHGALEADRSLWFRLQHVKPAPASDEDITRCHSAELIDQIREASERGAGTLDADTIISRQSFDVARLAAGAATIAVDRVVEGETKTAFVAARPPGHHAKPNKAMGFCLFNNAAIGARYAQAKHGLERILIIDWDVHPGNGTQEIFYSDPDVFYLSTHQYPYYPGTGAANETGEGPGANTVVNVPLGVRTSARDHRAAFSDALADIETRFHPRPDYYFRRLRLQARRSPGRFVAGGRGFCGNDERSDGPGRTTRRRTRRRLTGRRLQPRQPGPNGPGPHPDPVQLIRGRRRNYQKAFYVYTLVALRLRPRISGWRR